MATNEFTPTAQNNSFAFGLLEDELETLLCLSIALVDQLTPNDPNGEFDATPWRLAQVLNERLGGAAFTNNMRAYLLGTAESTETHTVGA
jgi:hypothetical protein